MTGEPLYSGKSTMRKERAVGLSICLVLLCAFRPGWPSGRWPLAALSLPQLVCTVVSGGHFVPYPWINPKSPHPSGWRSNPLASFLCMDWPPLNLVCNGPQLLGRELPALREGWQRYVYPEVNAFKNGIRRSFDSGIR